MSSSEAQRLTELAKKMRQEVAALEASLPKRDKAASKPAVVYVQRSKEEVTELLRTLQVGKLEAYASQLDELKEQGALKHWKRCVRALTHTTRD
jgi:hypothetical protein